MTTLLTTQSKKAWVAGVLAALLQPVLNLLGGSNVLTLRTLVVAIISGVLAAVAVWATENAEAPAEPTPPPAVEPPTTPAAAATAPAAPAQTVTPSSPFLADLQAEATKDFGGQSLLE